MANKATTEAPSLRDLSQEIQRASIRAKVELADARARLGEMRGQRELLVSAPLHRDDLGPELERHLQAQGREVLAYLRAQITELRTKSASMATTDPAGQAIYSPLDSKWVADLLPILLDPEESARRLLAAVGEMDTVGEGLPLAERRAALADLDRKIQAAEQHEAELIQGLQSAGIAVSLATDPTPEPKPGDEKLIRGELSRWVSFTGIPGTYGWLPISELEQAA